MMIPNMPLAKIAQPDGTIHPAWQQYFTQLTTALQQNVSNEGYIIPPLNTSQITTLTGTNTIGRIIYDTDNGVMKINNDGTFKQIMTV